jgi:DNA polymerase III subunit alpha
LEIYYPNHAGSLESADEISKHIDNNYDAIKFDIDDFFNDQFITKQINSFKTVRPDLDLEVIMRTLYKNFSGVSVHAGGLVIVDPTENIVPLVPLVDNDIANYASAFGESGTTKELEIIGKIKFDMLGLANLRMLHETVSTVAKGFNIPESKVYSQINPNSMNLGIKKIYESFKNGYTEGVFQFSSEGMTNLLGAFEPQSIDDLAICNALFRPGPLQNQIHKLIIEAKIDEKRRGVQYSMRMWNLIHDILDKTYSYPVFEEQVMMIGKRIADLDDSQLNSFRKFLKDGKVIKVSNPEKFAKQEKEFHERFIEKGQEKGLTAEELEGT